MQKPSKDDLLKHYSEREPTRFVQFDVFVRAEGDDLIHPDKDGDWLSCGVTHELMTPIERVRVLVTNGVTQEEAVRALKKVTEWIEKDPSLTMLR